MVDQDDELLGRSCDNLFLQERAASAFDEIKARIDLICPVDRDIDHPGIIGIDEDDPILAVKKAISERRGYCGEPELGEIDYCSNCSMPNGTSSKGSRRAWLGRGV